MDDYIKMLLNTDFDGSRSFSYSELLYFLRRLQEAYKETYDVNIRLNQELISLQKTFIDYDLKMNKNNQLMEDKNKEVNTYLNMLTKKLSLRERITGKINYFK